MLTEFGKVFAFILTAILFVIIAIFAAKLVRPARPTKEKLTTYECGENPEGSPWVKFNIRFYVVALIFLIFDVEVVMLIPWALVYQEGGIIGFLIGAIFLILFPSPMASSPRYHSFPGYSLRRGQAMRRQSGLVSACFVFPVRTSESDPPLSSWRNWMTNSMSRIPPCPVFTLHRSAP